MAAAVAVLGMVMTLLAIPAPAQAVTLPSGFTQSTYATGLGRVTAMAWAPDGRLFVASQDGNVRIVKNGATLSTPFLKLTTDDNVERGLTGIAIDPNFATNKFVYVYYATKTAPIHNRVSRFVAVGDVAQSSGGVPVETVLLDLDNLSSSAIHNGGAMHFGADDKLYVAVGENANPSNSQTLNNLLGKVLRINRDGSIPTDNPFYGTATGRNRAIWALGFRNPFSFGVQPGTGRIFVNDVGQSTWEEINDTVRGGNYGWPTTEGPTTDPRFVSPVYAYNHSTGAVTGCAITGGTFYNPTTSAYPASYVGKYFFADYCEHWIKLFDPATGSVTNFASSTTTHPVDLSIGPDGNLYYLSRGTQTVVKVSYTGSLGPSITGQPTSQTVSVGEPATFSVQATGAAPLSYQWQRNGSNISGATSASYTIGSTTTGDNGAQFRVVVTNPNGSTTSNTAVLTVEANQPPVGTIQSPADGARYVGGQTFTYSATASDPEDGVLPASAYTWTVDFHHDDHVHPFVPPTTGATSGQFTVATTGHTETNVWYRVILSVRDSDGRTHESFVDVDPTVSSFTLATNPAGLSLTLDGQPRTTTQSFNGVVGIVRTLSAPATQTVGGVSYTFDSWSDGGAQTHDIVTPSAATTYTATYRPVAGTTTVTLEPVADSYANAKAKSTNYGSSKSLAASGGQANEHYSYLRFTLPQAPAGKSLVGATLSYRTTDLASAGSDEVHSIRLAGESWTESGLTWNNRPAFTGDPIGSTPAGSTRNTRYTTALSADALDDRLGAAVTLGVTGTGTDRLWFWSRNHITSSYRPKLVLTWG